MLEVDAQLDVTQFWPTGGSDADTTKVVVQTQPGAFRFRPHPSAPAQVTRAFEGARVIGRTQREAISDGGQMVIRLEGIDAPELHYRPAAALKPSQRTAEQHALYLEWNLEYRQRLGETATRGLADLLATAGRNPLPCRITTVVDQPADVFDTYARFVGFLTVGIGGAPVDLNDWIVRAGWALPAFYSSMLPSEITALLAAAAAARAAGAGVWPHLSADTRRFDFALEYRGRGAALAPAEDVGAVLVPKMFRRVAEWKVNRRANMLSSTFRQFLRGKQEFCFATDDFLTNGITAATPVALADLIDRRGRFTKGPGEVVFQEAPSRLIGPGGAAVVW